MQRLAIVIPAFKAEFLDKTLKSIENQTNKEFRLYIGDDNSPDNLEGIVNRYNKTLDIVFKRFNENMGGSNLIAHWERCIDMIEDEEWIWFFSDDDIMETDCVQSFYNTMSNHSEYDIYHFNLKLIDDQDHVIDYSVLSQDELSVEEYIMGRINGSLMSYAVQYIFRRSFFFTQKRFQNFDLAWHSDDATWIKLGQRKGIKMIKNSFVYWRKSFLNISPNNRDKDIVIRKFIAQIEYCSWLMQKAEKNELTVEVRVLSKHLDKYMCLNSIWRMEVLPLKEVISLLGRYYSTLYIRMIPISSLIILSYYKIRITLKKVILGYKNIQA